MLDRILRNGDTAEASFLLGTRLFEMGDYPAGRRKAGRAVGYEAAFARLAITLWACVCSKQAIPMAHPGLFAKNWPPTLTIFPRTWPGADPVGRASNIPMPKPFLNRALPFAAELGGRGDCAGRTADRHRAICASPHPVGSCSYRCPWFTGFAPRPGDLYLNLGLKKEAARNMAKWFVWTRCPPPLLPGLSRMRWAPDFSLPALGLPSK